MEAQECVLRNVAELQVTLKKCKNNEHCTVIILWLIYVTGNN